MLRTASILLTALGLLICPFVCLGKTGSLCANSSASVACCQTASCCSAGEDDSPSSPVGDETPLPCDECNQDCVVSKGTIETGQKTPREITQSSFDSAFVCFVLPMQTPASLAFEMALCDHAASQQPITGWDLRVTLASFLL